MVVDLGKKKRIRIRVFFFFGPCLAALTAAFMFSGVNAPVWLLFIVAIPLSACYVISGWVQHFKSIKDQMKRDDTQGH